MLSAIGAVLPLAVGVALSPIPLLATMMLLGAPSGKLKSLAFLGGWVAGLALVSIVAAFVALAIPELADEARTSVILAALRVMLGLLLIRIAIRQWKRRPRAGQEPAVPKRLAGVASLQGGGAALLGFILAAVNPKNLLLAFAAGLNLKQGDHPVVVGIIFLVIASSSVGALVVLALKDPERLEPRLGAMQQWLVANNAVVTCVLLLVQGTLVVGHALSSF